MKKLWVIGSAVQDITMHVDLEWMARQSPEGAGQMIVSEGLQLKDGIWLTTQTGQPGLQQFWINIDIPDIKEAPAESRAKFMKDDHYVLAGGGKYTLREPVWDSDPSDATNALLFPGDDLSWGGGGLNVVRYIRALAPGPARVPLVYSDIAMASRLTESELQWPGDAERIFVEYSENRSLEAYLYRSSVEPALIYPPSPAMRRNWVISAVYGTAGQIRNKIVLRGAQSKAEITEEKIKQELAGISGEAGVMLLDSIRDQKLFDAAYEIFRSAGDSQNYNKVGMFALTEPMQQVAGKLIDDLKTGTELPPFILVFNEEELYSFAQRFGLEDELPFMMSADDIPNLNQFAKLVEAIRRHRNQNDDHRIYVTLGRRGSLGVNRTGQIVHVASYAKPDATIFDTNTCGDAYCAAIALLEWANRFGSIGNLLPERGTTAASEAEMKYFMAVATAAAYSRAVSRRGRVDITDVRDLLDHSYLACSTVLGNVFDLASPRSRRQTTSRAGGRLTEPTTAEQVKTSDGLDTLMSPRTTAS